MNKSNEVPTFDKAWNSLVKPSQNKNNIPFDKNGAPLDSYGHFCSGCSEYQDFKVAKYCPFHQELKRAYDTLQTAVKYGYAAGLPEPKEWRKVLDWYRKHVR